MTKYLDNIEDCTLEEFKLCLKGKFECLLLSGVYDENKARDAWFSIYDQYNEAINTKGNNIAFELKKQAHILSNEKVIISTCLFVIAELIKANFINFEDLHEFDEFIKVISKYGYKFDKEKPAESLKRIQQQLKNYDTRIKRELNKIEEIESKGEKWGFDDTIGAVEKFMSFQINEEKTTVRKFVSYLNQTLKQNG